MTRPPVARLHVILNALSMEQLKDVSAKEVALLGASSGSRTAAGGLDFTKGEAAPAGDDGREAET